MGRRPYMLRPALSTRRPTVPGSRASAKPLNDPVVPRFVPRYLDSESTLAARRLRRAQRFHVVVRRHGASTWSARSAGRAVRRLRSGGPNRNQPATAPGRESTDAAQESSRWHALVRNCWCSALADRRDRRFSGWADPTPAQFKTDCPHTRLSYRTNILTRTAAFTNGSVRDGGRLTGSWRHRQSALLGRLLNAAVGG